MHTHPKRHPDDILILSDGHWCFRQEFIPFSLRDFDHKQLLRGSDAWVAKLAAPRQRQFNDNHLARQHYQMTLKDISCASRLPSP
jgi:hypothetical protein